MKANLTYYIFEGLLTGIVDGGFIHILALSGGAGGSTKQRTAVSVNNPYMEGLKTKGAPNSKGHVHGGPIPPGNYVVRKPGHHPHLGLSARIDHPHFPSMGRDGFYIHGRGPHGSDGCIVPLDVNKFRRLMDSLTKTDGGVLVVEEAMGGGRFA